MARRAARSSAHALHMLGGRSLSTPDIEPLERRDCPAVMFTIQPPPSIIFEGDTGVFTVRLRQASTQPERIAVTVASGTATLGDDFLFSNSTQLLFAPGQVARTFSVRTFSDTQREIGGETFNITASSLTQPTATPVTRVGRIFDLIPSTLRAEDAQVVEGNSGTVNAVFTVRLEGSPATPVSVNYATADVTATAGTDYTATSGVLTFAVGETVKTISVPVTGDVIAEQNETFRLNFSNPGRGMTIATPFATGTIANDEQDQLGFQITVVFTSPVSTSQRAAFDAAAARWSQVITGDLPSVTLPNGTFIDDVSIDASIVAIDGVGGVLGQAGPDALRPGNGGLPYTGGMQFDTADVAALEANGTFQAVILHEMGHVLGIGSLWSLLGLVTGAGGNNPVFTGTNAVREYNAIFGVTGTSVPVENTGGPGTRDSHWREATMRTELMTGFAEPGGVAMPISRITVGSLADIGYTVNYAAADPYSRPQAIAPGTPPGGPQTPIHANPSPTPPTPAPTPVPTPTPPSTPKTPPKNPAPNPVPPGEQKPPAKSLGTISPGTIERPAAKPIANAMRAAAFAALAPR